MFSQEHPNTTAVTEAPLVGTETPHAKKTDLAPPTPPADTEAPLECAGSEAPQENIAKITKRWPSNIASVITPLPSRYSSGHKT